MSPNDFYAGASAAFVVILLTKFLTHRTRRPEVQSKDREDVAWWIGHWVCVVAAWLGLLLSLAVLGFPAFTAMTAVHGGSPAQPPRSRQRSLPWILRPP